MENTDVTVDLSHMADAMERVVEGLKPAAEALERVAIDFEAAFGAAMYADHPDYQERWKP